MKAYFSIWRRGFIIVTLTAINVGQVAGRHWLGAGLVGFGISLVWFYNARTAAHTELPHAGEVYAFGAACGTMFGMLITWWIYA